MDLSWVVRNIVREARQLLGVWTVVRTCGEESRGSGIARSNKEHVIWFEDVHGYYDGREVTKKDCRATFDLDVREHRRLLVDVRGWVDTGPREKALALTKSPAVPGQTRYVQIY